MAASIIIPSSPGATTLISHPPALSAAGYYSSRVSKRPCEPVKVKRTVRSHTFRDCGQNCSNRSLALDRVEAEKCAITYLDSVPSGSMDSTTNLRRNTGTSSNYESKKHGNSQPYSPIKTAKKRTKQGKSNKPVSPTLHRGSPPSPHPKPSSPTLRRSRPLSPHPSPPTRRGRPPSPHPNAIKSAASKLTNNTETALKLCKAEQESLGRGASSAVDSGRGEELSSSCDSDSQSKPISSVTTTTTQLAKNTTCWSTSASGDGDNDVFLDALSNFPSADEQECSPSTSAFVTPCSTRSQSPLLPLADPPDQTPARQDQQFIHSLTSSLQEVMETERAKDNSAFSMTDNSEQADSVFSRSVTGSSEAGDTDRPLISEHTELLVSMESTSCQKSRPKKRLNGLVQDCSAAVLASTTETQSVAPQQLKTGKKLSKNKRKKKVNNDAATDSCDSSITSDTVKKTHSSLKVPMEPPVQGSKKRSKNHKANQLICVESSSISSASPSSSVCSHSPVATSPSPTSFSGGNPMSVEQSIHPSLRKILGKTSSNLNSGGGEVAGKEEKTSGEKDEWPDLGMEYNSSPPKPPGSGVHLHLEVEAKSLELSPSECTEKEDSGCNMSAGSSTEESCASGGGFKFLEQLAGVSYHPIVNSNCYSGEVLSPQFGNPHFQSQQYLWMQSQQLNKFVQEHKEQQEQQTNNQIFYPIDPIQDHPPPCLPHHMTPMIQTPFLFQPIQLGPPRILDPRPLFFPAQPGSRDSQVPDQSSDPTGPPTPPPPPPLPLRPYHPTTGAKKWVGDSGVPNSTPEVAPEVGGEVAPEFSCEVAPEFTPEVAAPEVPHEVVLDLEGAATLEVDDEVFESQDEEGEYEYHQLADSWVMWYDRITGTTRNHSADYQASLIQLLDVSTVEGFWQLYNNILTPDKMEQNSNFHFFKQGIKPLWEHPANLDGGKWLLTIKNNTSSLTKSWLEVLLLLIGGCVKGCGLINGAVVSRRKKGDRISLWTNTRKEKDNLNICTYLMKAVLTAYGIKPEGTKSFLEKLAEGKSGLSLVFMHHRDSLKTGHSYQNDAHITLADHLDIILQNLQKIPG